MKKVVTEFGGAIILYIVIFFGIIAITTRVTQINNDNTTNKAVVMVNK